ncbi:MAG: carboxypeptidase-like regulatory domain-containing protein [Chlorobi bacterium]|nr:carboxypeptidase-like regulatory domain-containing protein [Chlorobiota bacterium]
MRGKDLLILTILILIISNQVVSQNYYLIKISVKDILNNKPIENASVKIQSTNIGSASSEYGYCEIVANAIPINIEISHVAYRKRVITIQVNQIHDTINLFLNPSPISLDEVNISAKKLGIFIQPDYSIIDFNFLNNQLLVLELNEIKLKESRLVLMNTFFDTIAILNLDKNRKPIKIYKDCLGQCHLLTKDSAYQIIFVDTLLSLNHSMALSRFHAIMDDCLFSIDSLLFFQKIDRKGYSYEYYTINVKNKEIKTFIKSSDYGRQQVLQRSIDFLKKHPPTYSLYVAIYFEKRFMYQPFKQDLKLIDNFLYYFNHQNSTIDIYSIKCDFVRNLNINYHLSTGWSSKILVDKTMGKAYTIIKNNLLEINLSYGETLFKANIGLAKKVLINNGNAYILKSEYNINQVKTFIKKTEIE